MRSILLFAVTLLIGVQNAELACQRDNPFDLSFRKSTEHLSVVPNTRDTTSGSVEVVDPDEEQIEQSVATGNENSLLRDLPKRPVTGNPFDLRPGETVRKEKEYAARPELPRTPDTLANKGESGSFLFWVLLISVLLLTVFINLNRSVPGQVNKAIFNGNYLKYLQRSYTSDNRFLYILFYFFFILNGGIFIFLIIRYFIGPVEWIVLFYCWAGLLILYFFRHQFNRYVQFVYPLEKTFGIFNFSIMIYNIFLGMALLPVNVIMAFSPVWMVQIFMYMGLLLVSGLFLLRAFRTMVNSLSIISAHPVHFFLYLCACEIMPVLIVAKFLYQVSGEI